MRYIIDIEANNLLGPALDYTELPYKLKPEFKVWCVVIRNVQTDEVISLFGKELTKKNMQKALHDCTELVAHNGIAYDFPILSLYGLFDYRIGYPGEESELFGMPCKFTDTLLLSKMLDADRLNGHSLAAWGKRLGNYKGNFEDWTKFSQEMLEYCVQDTNVTKSILFALEKEKGDHKWERPFVMETKLADLTLRQELFGFDFDKELAEKNIQELNGFMQEIAAKVDPILPPKQLTQVKIKEFTPPAKQFKKDGSLSSHMEKFCAKHNIILDLENRKAVYNGNELPLPIEEPICKEESATVEDIDVVKSYLLEQGWQPSEVKERDLVKNTDKTVKNHEEIVSSIERYIKQTEGSLFKQLRLEHTECKTVEELKRFLMNKIDGTKPIYVPTTPKLTVGVEKQICPNLESLGRKAEFVSDVVKYYTYRHRRNAIAGGTLDEDGEPETGFLSAIREDGRIPTPADTLGANTGRYRHKIVCNIPRVTSLYGEQMRNLFGCGKGLYQLGYDFASLEARIMGHYVMRYTDGPELAEALVAEKPNDIHSINARKLGIDRSSAKSFSYAAIYGAQPKKLAKMLGITEAEGKRLFNEYWDAVPALKELKAKVEEFWTKNGKKYIVGLDGRLLKTRSKHSLINVLFQSGGAIAAKWSSVRLAQRMDELGILGDPFAHSKKDVKVWWMIHQHDEQQMAVHPSLLKVKTFESEEDAKVFVKENQGCSAIGHGKRGYYVGLKTEPIDCIEFGINAACKELKLNVDLGFEYIPGVTWGQCH